MTVFELKSLLENKADDHYPISDSYNSTHGQRRGVTWSSQKEHLIPWLEAQATNGVPGFERKTPNTEAATMYRRLSCPECLLWLAEAAGVDSDLVAATAEHAKTLDLVVSRAAYIRHSIPWSLIESQLSA